MNIWSVILSPDFLFTSIRVMTPILFAAMACMVFVKGGIDPIGTEGIMLSCALAGPVGGYFTHSLSLIHISSFKSGCRRICPVPFRYTLGYSVFRCIRL